MKDMFKWKTRWTINKFKDEDNTIAKLLKEGYSIEEIKSMFPDRFEGTEIVENNIALNEGLQEIIDLICGLGSPTPYDATHAYIGIGDGTDAEDATQTGLTGTNKVYLPMDTGYPQRVDQTAIWRATADGSTANFAWNEFSVCNSNDESTGKNLNRKVDAKGTKSSGETWSVTVEITFS